MKKSDKQKKGPSCACGRQELSEPIEKIYKKEERSDLTKIKQIDLYLEALKKENKKKISNK